MNDEKIISILKNNFDKMYFRSTETIEQIRPNTLHFVKNLTYLYEYVLNNQGLDNLKNVHIIMPKEHINFVDKHKFRQMTFYPVDDVACVFGTIHNYIYNNMGFYTENKIHSSARIHPTASMDTEGIHLFHNLDKIKKQLKHISNIIVGEGTTIGPYTVIHKGVFRPTTIGNYNTIGNSVNIGHNCRIGDHVVITPGCVLAGRVNIGDRCWIGINSSFKHGIEICNNVIIGQHSNVRHNIIEPGIYAGSPLKKIGEYTENWNF